MTEKIDSDLLVGAAAIAEFVGMTRRQCLYLLERKQLPGGKLRGRWVGSKRKIRERIDQITSGKAAADD